MSLTQVFCILMLQPCTLIFMQEFQWWEQWLSLILLPTYGTLSFYWVALCSLNVKECVQSCCCVQLISVGCLPLSYGKWKKSGSVEERRYKERGNCSQYVIYERRIKGKQGKGWNEAEWHKEQHAVLLPCLCVPVTLPALLAQALRSNAWEMGQRDNCKFESCDLHSKFQPARDAQ